MPMADVSFDPRSAADMSADLSALPNLQATYCGTIAYQVEHIVGNLERETQ